MKRVNFVSLDSLTLQWFCNTLQTQHPQTQAAKELYDALEALYAGKSDSLMLELGEAIPEAASTSLVCGNLLIDSKSRRVIRDGAEIQLTPKEFDILYFLARNRGEVFTKEQIYQAVWAEEYYTADSNIMAFIRKLRKKIEPNPDAPEYILTIGELDINLMISSDNQKFRCKQSNRMKKGLKVIVKICKQSPDGDCLFSCRKARESQEFSHRLNSKKQLYFAL